MQCRIEGPRREHLVSEKVFMARWWKEEETREVYRCVQRVVK